MSEQKQHVSFYRKVALRKKLMPRNSGGVAYVPFIGDGDIATELYSNHKIYGADLDPMRVKAASARLKDATIKIYDCDQWPFGALDEVFSLADFDAYAYPYDSFKAWWDNAKRADTLTCFFTDGMLLPIHYNRPFRAPWDGIIKDLTRNEYRKLYNLYFKRYILPWFIEYIKPYKIKKKSLYLRGSMCYWGAVISK